MSKNEKYPEVSINAFPVCSGAGKEVKFLRPLRGYLWDTEVLIDGKSRLGFFERPLMAPMEWTKDEKTRSDTNMGMAAQLPDPQQFSLFGVHVSTTALSNPDRENLLFDARISFYFAGDRCYFSAMLQDLEVPEKSKRQWMDAVKRLEENSKIYDDKKKEYIPPDRETLGVEKEPLNVGKYALMIRPNETFRWEIVWSKPQKLFHPVLFRVAMYGIKYVEV
jgi:hypothetical protein